MKIEVEVTDQTMALVERYVSEVAHVIYEEPLTVETLAAMLLEDVALVVRRPGSWEASNIAEVLTSHGFYREEDV